MLPSFRSVPVSGQKKIESVIFVGIFNSRPPKHTDRKTNISAINCRFLQAFWTRNDHATMNFVQASKHLAANFCAFHCTPELLYKNK